jgi:3-methyladenine DNA glycosylase AlkD
MAYQDKISIVNILQNQMTPLSSQRKKEWWEKYMRYVIEFRGVGIPDIRKLQKNWYKENLQHLAHEEQIKIAIELFRQELAEDKLAGILLFQNYLFDKISLEYMIKQYDVIFQEKLIYDWNICDWFFVRVLTNTIKLYDMEAVKIISSWKNEPYLWKARASVVAFIGLTDYQKYYPYIFDNCKTLIQRDERFAKTSVGWILHDIYKIDEKVVFDFIDNNLKHFDKESLKNALKYTTKEIQKNYLDRLKKYNKTLRL